MTNPGSATIIKYAGEPPSHKGWNGLVVANMMTKPYWLKLAGLYWPGSQWPSVYRKSAGVTAYGAGDHSRRGKHGTPNFTPGPMSFASGGGSFLETGMTGDELNDFGTPGQFTAFVIGKFPNLLSHGIGPRNASTLDGWSIVRANSPGRYTLEVFYPDADPTGVTINADGDTGSVYEFLACTCRFDGSVQEGKLYRVKPGGVLQTSDTMVLTGQVKGADRIRLGQSVSANYTADGEIVGGGFFGEAFPGSGIWDLRNMLKACLLARPTPIVI